jgi:hypothetical protein
MTESKTTKTPCEIADAIVPEYRLSGKSHSCSGQIGKRWSAAYSAAELALKGATNG